MSDCAINVAVSTVAQRIEIETSAQQITVQPGVWEGESAPADGITQAQADARYLQKTTLSGATAIQVVDALPAAPDANTIYITTS